jgi:hypothetical protein
MSAGGAGTLNDVQIAERVQTQFVSGFGLSGQYVFPNNVSGTQRIVYGIVVTGHSSGNLLEVDRVPASGAVIPIVKGAGMPNPTLGVSPLTLPPVGELAPLRPVVVLNTAENMNLVLSGTSGQVANAGVWYWDRQ